MVLDITKASQFLAEGAVEAFESQVKDAQEALENGTCAGNDFLGWMHLPTSITPEFIEEINATAKVMQENCDAVVVAGIGGSYLGARMVIDALSDSFGMYLPSKAPRILFAGNNISEDYLTELVGYLKTVKFGVINISKSGTTTKTAIISMRVSVGSVVKYCSEVAAFWTNSSTFTCDILLPSNSNNYSYIDSIL